VIVDNDSSEGSCELLLQQPDVDVYHAAGSYAEANGGTLWLDPLMYERQEASGCVQVDADELLVYDPMRKISAT
jgi:hypothetical protein